METAPIPNVNDFFVVSCLVQEKYEGTEEGRDPQRSVGCHR